MAQKNDIETALPLLFAPSIAYMCALKDAGCVLFTGEQYGKQSYRNRADFIGAEGPFALSLPVAKYGYPAPPTSEIVLSEHDKWRDRHLRALKSAYGSTPFWPHYEEAIAELLVQRKRGDTSLVTFNLRWLTFLCDELGVIMPKVVKTLPKGTVLRTELASRHVPKKMITWPRYWQVFEQRFGFVPNLSALDLLLNIGPEGILYLDHCAEL